MNISKIATTATLAFAMIGGAIVLAPSNVEAAGKNAKTITYPALGKNYPGRYQKPSEKANPYNRGCSASTRCKRR